MYNLCITAALSKKARFKVPIICRWEANLTLKHNKLII
jgi:hypothetical protein